MQSNHDIHYATDRGVYRRYAVRRVNPFLGVLQVIKTPDGRALSTNGVVWDVEIVVDQPVGWGSLNQSNHESVFYRIGQWSQQEGLIKRPLAPHMTSDLALEQCEDLVESIRHNLDALPFKLIDREELWLFDARGEMPLALLDARVPGTPRQSPEVRYWKAALGAEGVPGQYRFGKTSELEVQVKKRAGFNVCKKWVSRQPDGSGVIDGTDDAIAATHFPAYLLSRDWQDRSANELVEEYINWTAPALLTLQHLQQHERAYLEERIMQQAVSIEYHWQLYPQIIDHALVDAARVKSQLLSVNGQDG